MKKVLIALMFLLFVFSPISLPAEGCSKHCCKYEELAKERIYGIQYGEAASLMTRAKDAGDKAAIDGSRCAYALYLIAGNAIAAVAEGSSIMLEMASQRYGDAYWEAMRHKNHVSQTKIDKIGELKWNYAKKFADQLYTDGNDLKRAGEVFCWLRWQQGFVPADWYETVSAQIDQRIKETESFSGKCTLPGGRI